MPILPTLEDIQRAAKLIKQHIHRTPVITCQSINALTGAKIYFKCENFQKVGAFKFRGACNALFSLSDDDAQCGVATHSSGNHAQALALAAKLRGIKAHIVMPNNAPEVKKAAVKSYGGEITYCEPTLAAREAMLRKVVEDTRAAEIHPYNDLRIIAGQGTAALELLEHTSELDTVMAPVGGGGLLSGTALVATSLSSKIEVVAAEPQGADDAYRSFKAGKIIPSMNPHTIADGLLTSLGDITFPIIQERVKEIITVSEEDILLAMRHIWERAKIVVEPSAAVPLGAVLANPSFFSGKRIGMILSGGNIDLTLLKTLYS
ncbi:pyridoxal-phosphate dependent enzyme [Oligoflexia bacterium]|nr:pyridoxal-phosphate dependent enzyme [Oligoflexia bacterium]